LLEGEWSFGRAGSLFLLALMLGPLMVAPTAAITGMISGITLFRLGRNVFSESDERTSETSGV
jgi:hypothetical protein